MNLFKKKELAVVEKRCTVCGEMKPLGDYCKNKRIQDGLHYVCKGCQKLKAKLYRETHKGQLAEIQRRYLKTEAGKRTRRRYKQSEKGKASVKRDTRKRMELYPEKYEARYKAMDAVNTGILKKQPCEICGSSLVEKHHSDYSKPLDINWLCPEHHRELHRREA